MVTGAVQRYWCWLPKRIPYGHSFLNSGASATVIESGLCWADIGPDSPMRSRVPISKTDVETCRTATETEHEKSPVKMVKVDSSGVRVRLSLTQCFS